MVLALKQESKKDILYRLIPYILILLASIFGGIVLFYTGFPRGDDVAYHFSNIYDMYLDLKSGSIAPISDTLASGFGFGKNLFYSPLVHLTTALLAIILEPFGVTLLGALKFNLFISIFLSGIFMYRFGMHISKNKRIVSLIAALIYVLYPYRYFDMLCRVALAEAYAFLFFPLFFMGLYDFIHIEDRRTGGMIPCLEIILGGSLLFLTHNISAIYAYFFGIIYLLFHVKKIYYLFKYDKSLILYAVISAFLLLGIASKTLFSAYSLYQTKLYNVSDEVRMWTNAEYLANRNDFEWYSGLLNLEYLTGRNCGINIKTASLDALYFSISTLGIVLLDHFIAKIKLKYVNIIHSVIAVGLGIALAFIFQLRTEVILGVILFLVTYLFYSYKEGVEGLDYKSLIGLFAIAALFFVISMVAYKTVLYGFMILASLLYAISYSVLYKKKKAPKLYRESHMDLYYLVFAHIVTLVLIIGGSIWYIMPETLRTIQFPWRLFGFLSFFTAILTVEVLKNIKSKYFVLAASVGAAFLMVVSEAIPEKTLAYDLNKEGSNPSGWLYELSDSLYKDSGAIGACREYFPKIYYYNETYTPIYENSLYRRIRNHLMNTSLFKMPNPVIISGEAQYKLDRIQNEEITYILDVKEDNSLIQIPITYDASYKVNLVDNNGNLVNVDILSKEQKVAFYINMGSYRISYLYSYNMIQNIKPVVLDGEGTIKVNRNQAPEIELDLEVSKDETLIQLPLIYYPGYKISLEDSNGNKEVIDAIEVDGLVSFKVNTGSYKVMSSYEGTTLMKLGNIYQIVAIPLTLGAMAFFLLLDNKKRIAKENVFNIEK